MNEETFTPDAMDFVKLEAESDIGEANKVDILEADAHQTAGPGRHPGLERAQLFGQAAALSLANSERRRLEDLAESRQQIIERADSRMLELHDERDTARACQREAERELQNFKDKVYNRMCEEADRRDWCGEFDDILVEFGFPPRRRLWDVTFEINGYATRQIMARDAVTAERLAWEELPLSAGEQYRVNHTDVHIRDIEADVSEADE